MGFLQIRDLHKSFGQIEVLKHIDLAIEDGGFLVLVGPSGCGKSTLLNIVAGLETASSGEVSIDGRRVNDLPAAERDIAMVFQSYALYPNMNVEKNISFGLEMRGVPRAERKAAVERVAGMLQIEPLLKRRPGQLSGGQRQRVAMGRALVRNPQVFLFDEPLSNLDAKLRVDMRTEIKKLHQTLGTTIIYVTHDQIEAMTLATQIAVLKDGALQQVGTPQQVYGKPENMFVADFMGSPAMNHTAGRLEAAADSAVSFVFDGGALTVVQPSAELRQRCGSEVVFGIRAEDITDRNGANSNSSHLCSLHCTVDIVEPTGADTFVVTRDREHSFTARLRAVEPPGPGTPIELAFDMNKAHFFDPDTQIRID